VEGKESEETRKTASLQRVKVMTTRKLATPKDQRGDCEFSTLCLILYVFKGLSSSDICIGFCLCSESVHFWNVLLDLYLGM
jgi:hypothetical protein